MGYKPKVATIGRAILLPSGMEAVGEQLSFGLITEIRWSPCHPYKSSRTGLPSEDLAKARIDKVNKQRTRPQGRDQAGFEAAENVLKRTPGPDNEALRQTIMETNLNTMKYNSENDGLTPVVRGQWGKGKKHPFNMEVVYNKPYPQIPLTAEMKSL